MFYCANVIGNRNRSNTKKNTRSLPHQLAPHAAWWRCSCTRFRACRTSGNRAVSTVLDCDEQHSRYRSNATRDGDDRLCNASCVCVYLDWNGRLRLKNERNEIEATKSISIVKQNLTPLNSDQKTVQMNP